MPVCTPVSTRDSLLRDQTRENITETPKQNYTSKEQAITGLNIDSKRPNINSLCFLILEWYCMCVGVILLAV